MYHAIQSCVPIDGSPEAIDLSYPRLSIHRTYDTVKISSSLSQGCEVDCSVKDFNKKFETITIDACQRYARLAHNKTPSTLALNDIGFTFLPKSPSRSTNATFRPKYHNVRQPGEVQSVYKQGEACTVSCMHRSRCWLTGELAWGGYCL